MVKTGHSSERSNPPDPKINLWFQLPNPDALIEAVGNLKRPDIKKDPNLKNLVRNRIRTYEDDGRISTETAVSLEEHLTNISQPRKQTS